MISSTWQALLYFSSTRHAFLKTVSSLQLSSKIFPRGLTFTYRRILSLMLSYLVLTVWLILFVFQALLVTGVLSLHAVLLAFIHVPLSLSNVEALYLFVSSSLFLALITLVLLSLKEFYPSLLSFSKSQHQALTFISNVVTRHQFVSSFTLLHTSTVLEQPYWQCLLFIYARFQFCLLQSFSIFRLKHLRITQRCLLTHVGIIRPQLLETHWDGRERVPHLPPLLL